MHELAKVNLDTLSDKQLIFVRALAEGHKQTKAAEMAGYSHPAVEGHRLMRLPHIVASVRQERDKLFCGELAGLAIDVLRDVLNDKENTPAHVRLDASKFVLKVAGHIEKTQKALALEVPDKAISDMTEEELSGYIERGGAALKLIEGTVTNVEPEAPEVSLADDCQ